MMISKLCVRVFDSISARSMVPSVILLMASSTVESPESVMLSGSIVTLASLLVAPPPSRISTSSATSLYFTTFSVTSTVLISMDRFAVSTAFPSLSQSVNGTVSVTVLSRFVRVMTTCAQSMVLTPLSGPVTCTTS